MRLILALTLTLAAGVLIAADATPRLLIIGDSISGGYREPLRDALSGTIDVHRIPTNGRDTRTGLQRIDEWLGDEPWDIIVFNWGLHDLKNGSDDERILEQRVAAYGERLTQLVTRLQATNARLIWVTITPVPEPNQHKRLQHWVTAFNQHATALMLARGIEVVNTHDVLLPVATQYELPARNPNLRDVHYTPGGYRLMANTIAAAILGTTATRSASR